MHIVGTLCIGFYLLLKMSLERFYGDSTLKQKVMYTKSHGNQEANIHSWKNDRNSVFSYKQPAVF